MWKIVWYVFQPEKLTAGSIYILLINLILIYFNLLQKYRVEANKIETNKMKHTTRKRLCNIVKRACWFPFFIFLFGSQSNNTYWNVSTYYQLLHVISEKRILLKGALLSCREANVTGYVNYWNIYVLLSNMKNWFLFPIYYISLTC